MKTYQVIKTHHCPFTGYKRTVTIEFTENQIENGVYWYDDDYGLPAVVQLNQYKQIDLGTVVKLQLIKEVK